MRVPSRSVRWSLISACVLTASGCGPLAQPSVGGTGEDVGAAPRGSEEVAPREGSSGAGSEPSPRITANSISNEAVVALAREGTYRGTGYRRVDASPFASTVSPDKRIALYVSEAGYEAYRQISPHAVGSGVTLPVGTVIVREVWGGAALSAITIMVQLQKGTFPLGGDFWYASLSPEGEVNHDAQTGEPQLGLSERCGTCHLRRSEDGFLFGVPPSALP